MLIFLNATAGGVSIISRATVAGVPVGTASDAFTIVFSLAIRIIKKLLKTEKA